MDLKIVTHPDETSSFSSLYVHDVIVYLTLEDHDSGELALGGISTLSNMTVLIDASRSNPDASPKNFLSKTFERVSVGGTLTVILDRPDWGTFNVGYMQELFSNCEAGTLAFFDDSAMDITMFMATNPELPFPGDEDRWQVAGKKAYQNERDRFLGQTVDTAEAKALADTIAASVTPKKGSFTPWLPNNGSPIEIDDEPLSVHAPDLPIQTVTPAIQALQKRLSRLLAARTNNDAKAQDSSGDSQPQQ